jgi:hypothetical protein
MTDHFSVLSHIPIIRYTCNSAVAVVSKYMRCAVYLDAFEKNRSEKRKKFALLELLEEACYFVCESIFFLKHSYVLL